MLPPESAPVAQISRELGVSGETLERWRADSLASPSTARTWTAVARLDAVLAIAALNEAERSAWCREKGLFISDLDAWRQSATAALAGPDEKRATPSETRQDHKRIKELERELLRKDRALAEAAALLVLSKKVRALYGGDEDN